MAVALHVGAQAPERFRFRLHGGGDCRHPHRIEHAEIALVALPQLPELRFLVGEQRLDKLLQGAGRLLRKRAPGVEDGLAGCRLAKNGKDEEPRETVRPGRIGQHARR